MATVMYDQFKKDCLNGKNNIAGASPNTYKMLLIKVGATGTYGTANYLTAIGTPGAGSPTATNVGTDEVTGTGYTSGGFTMTSPTVSVQTDTATVDWSTNPNWAAATFSAIGAILYNSTNMVPVAYFDFGGTQSCSNGTFTVTLPASGAATSLVRFA